MVPCCISSALHLIKCIFLPAGGALKRIHSKGGQSKKQLTEDATANSSEQAAWQQDLIAVVGSSNGGAQQQQQQEEERLQEQVVEQVQQQQPYELQMQEGEIRMQSSGVVYVLKAIAGYCIL